MQTTEKLYTLTLDSGAPVYVRSLSPIARAAIMDAAIERYPDPDKAPFEQPAPNAPPGVNITIPAEENPEYVQQRYIAQVRRMNHVNDAIIRGGVVCDSPLGKQFLIDHYAPLRQQMLKVMTLGELDVWTETVITCLIRTRDDAIAIANAASEVISADEVRRAMKSFRRDVQWTGFNGNFSPESTPSA